MNYPIDELGLEISLTGITPAPMTEKGWDSLGEKSKDLLQGSQFKKNLKEIEKKELAIALKEVDAIIYSFLEKEVAFKSKDSLAAGTYMKALIKRMNEFDCDYKKKKESAKFKKSRAYKEILKSMGIKEF